MDPMEDINRANGAQLHQALNMMFPPAYIELHHEQADINSSLFLTKCCAKSPDDCRGEKSKDLIHEASTEPSSRVEVIKLKDQLDSSLSFYRARLYGLCEIRRKIYDQCFDELIRRITVNCVDQGLLLFRVRNELRMTLESYRKAYESGVAFGLRKAQEAEIEKANAKKQLDTIKNDRDELLARLQLKAMTEATEAKNELDSTSRMREYYQKELSERDQVIHQQQRMVEALSQKLSNELREPLIDI